MSDDRHSQTEERALISDPAQLAFVEARNALRQFDAGFDLLRKWLEKGTDRVEIRPSDLLRLNRVVLEGVSHFAGTYRASAIRISGSGHTPPPADDVAALVEECCAYVNQNWANRTAIHLSAYVLWRLNWIHPFADGNGRTARIASYIVLCAKLGYILPGSNTIPEQISENKTPYYKALEEGVRSDGSNLQAMEMLISDRLAKQLISIHNAASQLGDRAAVDVTRLSFDNDQADGPPKRLTVWERIEKHPVLVGAVVALVVAIVGAITTYLYH